MYTINDVLHAKAQWYVVHCKRLNERQAATALEKRLGLATYLPEIQRRRRGQVRCSPFFPSYLFVWADLREVIMSHINAMPGVLRLISFGDLPQPVPISVVEEIRQRVDELNAHGGLIPHNFRPGDALRLKEGPLQGLDVVFVGSARPSDRVRVLLEFLGRLSEVKVTVDLLERVSAGSTLKPERRTRGKGRRTRTL
jgi:transcription antitermination factor NusG